MPLHMDSLVGACAHSFTVSHNPSIHSPIHPPVRPGGELFDHVYHKGSLPEADAACIMQQLASFLAYAHSKHIMHRWVDRLVLKLSWQEFLALATGQGGHCPSLWVVRQHNTGTGCVPAEHHPRAVVWSG